VVSAQPQTPLHHAFFQRENVKDKRKKANALWKSLVKTYDDLVDDELEKKRPEIEKWRKNPRHWKWDVEKFDSKQTRAKEERELPLAARSLMISRECYVVSDSDLASKVLSGNSTFGLNFSRKATTLEAKIIVDSLRQIAYGLSDKLQWRRGGDSEESVNKVLGKQIRSRFFQEYPLLIDEKKKSKLLTHQMNCAVVALESLWTDYKVADTLSISGVDKFDFIDEQLQDMAPAGKMVNSRTRFERLNALYPEAFSADAVY
jgi:hypothetical protein